MKVIKLLRLTFLRKLVNRSKNSRSPTSWGVTCFCVISVTKCLLDNRLTQFLFQGATLAVMCFFWWSSMSQQSGTDRAHMFRAVFGDGPTLRWGMILGLILQNHPIFSLLVRPTFWW